LDTIKISPASKREEILISISEDMFFSIFRMLPWNLAPQHCQKLFLKMFSLDLKSFTVQITQTW
jgi:hypothetical protein